MAIDQHNLAHEFSEHREKIHLLKMENAHFAKLFDEYDAVTKKVERLEGERIPVGDEVFEDLKKQRLLLKDQLYTMLIA